MEPCPPRPQPPRPRRAASRRRAAIPSRPGPARVAVVTAPARGRHAPFRLVPLPPLPGTTLPLPGEIGRRRHRVISGQRQSVPRPPSWGRWREAAPLSPLAARRDIAPAHRARDRDRPCPPDPPQPGATAAFPAPPAACAPRSRSPGKGGGRARFSRWSGAWG